MKKFLIPVLLLLLMCSVNLNAQISFYNGIRSGMSSTEVNDFLNSRSEYTFVNDTTGFSYYETMISGRKYFVVPGYNEYGQLYAVTFNSDAVFLDGQENLAMKVVEELYSILEQKYGEPEISDTIDFSLVASGEVKAFYIFGAEPSIAGISVGTLLDGSHYLLMAFADLDLEPVEDLEDYFYDEDF